MSRTTLLLAAGALIPFACAGAISFTGDLRTNATFFDCGPGCTLSPANTDGDYAQYAAAVYMFNVPVASTMSAITFSYGGGTNGNGALIAPNGFEPYLSLFDSSGNFLASTFSGTTCPASAHTNSTTGFCYDVGLDGGTLLTGAYSIAISAFENMSLAENPGGFVLSDGFTGLGNLAAGEDLHYAFDVLLTSQIQTPEPGSAVPVFAAVTAVYLFQRRRRNSI